jgi:hypothetical protein
VSRVGLSLRGTRDVKERRGRCSSKVLRSSEYLPITSFLFHSEAKSLFEEKDYKNAIQKYTEAIGADSTGDVTFFSNRRFVVLSLIAINEISLVLAMAH